jgi:hypothetical protein
MLLQTKVNLNDKSRDLAAKFMNTGSVSQDGTLVVM